MRVAGGGDGADKVQEGGGWVSREDGVRRQRIGCGTSTAEKGSGRACPKWAAVGACRKRSAANTRSKIAAPSKIERGAKRMCFGGDEETTSGRGMYKGEETLAVEARRNGGKGPAEI